VLDPNNWSSAILATYSENIFSTRVDLKNLEA
jgi:hypothetical protein